MALSAKALTTVSRISRVPGINLAPEAAEDLINEASEAFASEVGRDIHYEVDAIANLRGYGSSVLRLYNHVPLVSISSIVFDGNAIDSDDYEIVATDDPNVGHIRAKNSNWAWTADRSTDITGDPLVGTERALYVVTYTGGYVTPQQDADDDSLTRNLPYDIERAVIDMIVSIHRGDGRDGRVRSKKVSRGSVEYADDGLPPSFRRVAAKYMRGL